MLKNQAKIDELIEKIGALEQSEANRSRGKTAPTVNVIMEEPITWVGMYEYDVDQYFGDTSFFVEQFLRQKLWLYENIRDDTRLNLDIPALVSYFPEYSFFDIGYTYDKNGVPNILHDHPISKQADLRLLKPVDFKTSGCMPQILQRYEEMNEISKGRLNVAMHTWSRGCLDIAIELRGYENFIVDAMTDGEFAFALMEFITEQRIRWYEAYYQFMGVGAQPTKIADDWINVPFITPELFGDYVLPCYKKMERYHGSILEVHACGNQVPVQKYLLELKSFHKFEISPWSDVTQSMINIPPDKELLVRLHPNDVLYATPAQMAEKLKFITESCRGRNYHLWTSGLTYVFDNEPQFVKQINTWVDVARKVLSDR